MGKIMCLVCGNILESKSRHDFQRCKCDNETSVDGGYDELYLPRYGAKDLALVLLFDEKKNRWVTKDTDKHDKDTTKGKWWQVLERAIAKEEQKAGKKLLGEEDLFLHDKK